MSIILLLVLGVFGCARADCYPGDTNFTGIVQQIYNAVTSDRIVLAGTDQPIGVIDRQQLCEILIDHHNFGTNPGQPQTNGDFLGSATVSLSACVDALTYTQGYNTTVGWEQWAGNHTGHRYSVNGAFFDEALWSAPSYVSGMDFVFQQVRFDSPSLIRIAPYLSPFRLVKFSD